MNAKITIDAGDCFADIRAQLTPHEFMKLYDADCDTVSMRPVGMLSHPALLEVALALGTHDEIAEALLEKYSVEGILNTIRDYARLHGLA